jgi:hypothetical protein
LDRRATGEPDEEQVERHSGQALGRRALVGPGELGGLEELVYDLLFHAELAQCEALGSMLG